MTQILIFADASLVNNEASLKANEKADLMHSQPAKSAGPYRIATEARAKGFSCQIINLLFHFNEQELLEICNKFIDSDTLIVGFSTTFWDNPNLKEKRKLFIKTIISYTKKYSSAKIILGGTLSLVLGEIIKADACFTGFGEAAFNNYVDSLITGIPLTPNFVTMTGTNVFNFYSDNNKFDFNSSKILYTPEDCLDYNESVVIEITRGCIFKCDFCAYPLNGKQKLDYIKYENVIKEELIRNYETYGITNYTFSDDTFNDSPYKVELLHNLFTSLPFKIQFSCYLRLDLLYAHQHEIALLKDMGLIGAFFGVESLNYNSAKSIGKGMKPEKIKEFLYDLKDRHWKNNINVTIGLISGLPYETKQSHTETINWILNEKECLVDRIRPAALAIPNPLLDKQAFKSNFQLHAGKYGFYWPDKASHNWKNMSHYVKSREQAFIMAKEIFEASDSVYKTTKGNFMLMLASNISKYADPPLSLENLCSMDNRTFTTWYKNNYVQLTKKYVDNYKQKIFNL